MWVLNQLLLDRAAEVDAGALIEALDRLQSDLRHRRAFTGDAVAGARLAAELRPRGWRIEHHVVMVLSRPRDREPAPGLAREVAEPLLRAVETRAFGAEPIDGGEDVAAQLAAGRAALCAAAPHARYFVGAWEGEDGAATTLYSDGRLAQVEDVGTLPELRRRGLARATVCAAVDAALDTGHELVFIVADHDDWPRELYAKLGFDAAGSVYGFSRPTASTRRPPA